MPADVKPRNRLQLDAPKLRSKALRDNALRVFRGNYQPPFFVMVR